ncbi:MAG: RNA pseudouridine synthase, partial [Proteobacteria bacterium]|nr:RNA pseudouridine synthase [Pseudomonadota bacterium]
SFRSHQLTKTYVAVAESRPKEDEGILEHWLIKNKETNVTSVSKRENHDAKYCKLSYKFIGGIDRYSLIEVQPVTGRSHQIRVQMAAIGCPLFGDQKYGAQSHWDGRVALHAYSLRIKHPVGSELLNLTAPLPVDWNSISTKVDFAFNNYLQKGNV